MKNKDIVVHKYGKWAWRNWAIFLAWSHIIAAQGSSTVFMMVLQKNFANDKMSVRGNKGRECHKDNVKLWVDSKFASHVTTKLSGN